MKHFFILIAAMLGLSSPSFGDTCDDLWFSRNMIFDQAGHCFSSDNAKRIFDNQNCTGAVSKLPKDQEARVSTLRGMEKELGCKVNSSSFTASFPDLKNRFRLKVQPVALDGEFACVGWKGPEKFLLNEPSLDGEKLGYVLVYGDVIGINHMNENFDWDYVTIFDAHGFKAAGWTYGLDIETNCEMLAG